MEGGIKIVLLVLMLWVARWIGFRIIDAAVLPPWTRQRLPETQQARLRTIQTILHSLLHYVLIFIGALTILGVLGVNLAPILTTAGVTGLAIGFGAQRLVRDVIGGFFILLEDQFAVGDYVTIDSASGIVEEMGMRITRLRDEEGRLVIIANGDIGRVINHSRGAVRGIVEFAVAPTLPLEEARQCVKQLCSCFEHEALKEPPQVVGLGFFDASRSVFRIEFRAVPEKMGIVQMALREHLLQGAREMNLPIV